jgi:hypothetical protein
MTHDRGAIDNTLITNDNQVQAAVPVDDRSIPTKVLGHERRARKESFVQSVELTDLTNELVELPSLTVVRGVVIVPARLSLVHD